MELTEIIRRGIVTEKSVEMQEPTESQKRAVAKGWKTEDQLTHKYVFEVALTANKIQIRQAVELLFPEVKVLAVNTMRMPGKTRTVRTRRGYRRSAAKPWKKAIVTVRATDIIPQLQP
jgi:large subunit ribosomal protein L23